MLTPPRWALRAWGSEAPCVQRERDLALLWTTHWNHLTRQPQPLHLFALSARPLGAECKAVRVSCLCVLHFFLNWKGKINKQQSEKGTGIHLRIISCPCQQKGCAWCGFIWTHRTYKANKYVFVATGFCMEVLVVMEVVPIVSSACVHVRGEWMKIVSDLHVTQVSTGLNHLRMQIIMILILLFLHVFFFF